MSNPSPEQQPDLGFPIDGNEAQQIEHDDDLVDGVDLEDEDEGRIPEETDPEPEIEGEPGPDPEGEVGGEQ